MNDATKTVTQEQTKACPFCGEIILSVAKKCKHCGEFLDGSKQTDATPYILLALFFGGFGAHNFYAGQSALGLTKLVISIVAVLTWGFGVGILLMGVNFVWCLIDIFSFSNSKVEKVVTPEQEKSDHNFFLYIIIGAVILIVAAIAFIFIYSQYYA